MEKILHKNYSKEVIKARILNNAAKLWGVQNPNSLDPLVTLLIDAFSTEIFKVNNEIEDIKSRILEKTARLLTPSIYTYPRPAHAIAFIEPESSNELFLNHNEFFTKKQFSSQLKTVSDAQIDIPFTPVDNIHLVKARTELMFVNSTCYSYDRFNNKIPVARLKDSLAYNKIVLGIDFSEYDAPFFPKRLTLFCKNTAFESIEFVYKLLPLITVSTQGKLLTVEEGISFVDEETKEGYDGVFEKYTIKTRMEENIKSIYFNQFIEVVGFGEQPELLSGMFPASLAFAQENKNLTDLIEDKNYLWLEFDFPPQFTPEILDSFTFILNAFPVYNRGWKQNESALDIMGNSIPLATDIGQSFLYTDRIVDSYGRAYNMIPFAKSDSLQKGLFTIRKGGMERFNERNAVDMIANVLELTRDEVSAFGVVDRDKVVEALQNMTMEMRKLDQKLITVEGNVSKEMNYVVVEPYADTEHLSASYWVTYCALGNTVRMGSVLVQQNKTYSNKNRTITLLTTTQGGEEEQKGTDAIQAYKYALTTRDKIVSTEDIKSYCKMVLQTTCLKVNVFKGTIISDKPKEGFIRTINIDITMSDYKEFSTAFWVTKARALKKQIVDRAIDGIEYVVSFKAE